MKNVFLWLGVALIVVATIIAQFTGVETAVWIELSGFSIGLASCIVGVVTKAEKKDWKLYLSIFGIVIGSTLLVFAGISKDVITSLITAVAGVVVIIVGLLPVLLKKKEENKA